MVSDNCVRALLVLRQAADAVNSGFPETEWQVVSGAVNRTVHLDGGGTFHGLEVSRNATITLKCMLDLPEAACGVQLAGDVLEATLFCIYPTSVRFNGRSVFEDELPPVASGPSLFEVTPTLSSGRNGELLFAISTPDQQMTGWVNLHLTTPGLRRMYELLDVTWSHMKLAAALAATDAERALVDEAARAVPADLAGVTPPVAAEMADTVSRILAPFASRVSSLPVHLIGHSHIDMNWLWQWPDTEQVILRDFRSVLALMREFDELTFSHSQPPTYEVLKRHEPDLFEEVRRLVREGRWELLTTAWIENDSNMSGSEAHARQILEGVTWTREHFGISPTVYHAPDTFGHVGNMPQLVASGGASRYYHHRANPGGANAWPAYWWQGQNGDRVLAFSTPSYNGEITAHDITMAAIRAHAWGLPAGIHFHGIGDHGGGPARQSLEARRRFAADPLLPPTLGGTLAGWTQAVVESSAVLPEAVGESATIFEGCYTTHADTKQYNRHGENQLIAADTLAALAGMPDGLTAAWRKVLFNQFHDILDGSAIHEAYEQNRIDVRDACDAAARSIQQSLAALQAGVPADAIAVTNPLGEERCAVVESPGMRGSGAVWMLGPEGRRALGQYSESGLLFAPQMKPFETAGWIVDGEANGVEGVTVRPAYAPVDDRPAEFDSEGQTSAPYIKVETAAYTAHVRRDSGVIVSLFDKRVRRELVGFGMKRGSDYLDTARPDLGLNVFQIVDEHPHGMSAWHLDEVYREESLIRGAETSVTAAGPAFVELQVRHKVRKSSIVQRMRFYSELPQVDFVTNVDWQELGTPEAGVPSLKAAFTASLAACEAWFETPFGAACRPASGQESPALRWAAVGEPSYGFALLNTGKYGYDALGSRLRITLLRSGYDPDAISDVGQHSIIYSLLFYPEDWCLARVPTAAASLNIPLVVRDPTERRSADGGAAAATPQDGAFAPKLLEAQSVRIECLKPARHGDGMVVRMYESSGRSEGVRLCGLPAGANAWTANIVEDRVEPVQILDGRIHLDFAPWQVRTVIIEHGAGNAR
ncbi:MAG: hypothetical protein KGJ62_10055 [Armatimonadetes bacterium]|nr:hypothetical protein [Armatimonadota bacterium]MDE2206692.1 hypothetical protein [Armatimonadota bacterium]